MGAMNSVRDLDSAFLRHGRFDYVIGPPEPRGRISRFRARTTVSARSGPPFRRCSNLAAYVRIRRRIVVSRRLAVDDLAAVRSDRLSR